MEKINFIPGPATISKDTLLEASRPVISHRNEEFCRLYSNCADKLKALTNAEYITFLTGSGTLANDVIGAQIKLLNQKGLIISNGEFGERLVEQAQRLGLTFKHLSYTWGNGFDYQNIFEHIDTKKYGWIWFTHCETSTGMLNNLGIISDYCKTKKVKVCVDAISSLGNTDVDLSNIYLASATSGKGLAALPGLAIVFSAYKAKPCLNLPKYLDLGYYHFKDGLPFTLSANLLGVLNVELSKNNICDNIAHRKRLGAVLKKFARKKSFQIIGEEAEQSGYIFTFQLPGGIKSDMLGEYLKKEDILIHYKNPYLISRNWIQISLMGYTSLQDILKLKTAVNCFVRLKEHPRAAAGVFICCETN